MRTRSRWLIITHGFEVQGDRASQIVSQRIPVLSAHGVEPFVVSGGTGSRNRTFPHYQRSGWGPTGLSEALKLISDNRNLAWRTAAVLADWMMLPLVAVEQMLFGATARASWVLPATMTGLGLTRNLPFDLIYSSGGAASAHLAAALIKAQTGLPWLAELQTPIVAAVAANHGASSGDAPRTSRREAWLAKLEGRICTEADLVCFTHPVALDHARTRVPALGDRGFYALPGADAPAHAAKHQYTKKLRLCHFGDVTTNASMAPLVRAIALLRTAHPGVEQNLRIRVYGQIRDAATTTALKEHQLEQLIEQQEMFTSDQLRPQIPAADCVLLIQGQNHASTETVPLALYDYLASARPVMAITHHNHFLDKLVVEHEGYIGHASREDTIKTALVHLIADWHAKRLSPRATPPVSVESGVRSLLDRVALAHFFVSGQTETV